MILPKNIRSLVSKPSEFHGRLSLNFSNSVIYINLSTILIVHTSQHAFDQIINVLLPFQARLCKKYSPQT